MNSFDNLDNLKYLRPFSMPKPLRVKKYKICPICKINKVGGQGRTKCPPCKDVIIVKTP